MESASRMSRHTRWGEAKTLQPSPATLPAFPIPLLMSSCVVEPWDVTHSSCGQRMLAAGDGGPDLSLCQVYLFPHPCQAGSSFSKSFLRSAGHPMGDRLSTHAGLGAAEILLVLAGLCVSGPADIRLVNGPDSCTGRLEVFYNGTWGTVCDDHWDLNGARVVCQQLGCGTALSAVGGARYGRGADPIWLDNVRCAGTEAALSECQARPWGAHNCGHGEDASVVCSGAPSLGLTYTRLVNGSSFCSGRVEVFHNGKWGTVCDDSWSLTDAEVVCREVGCGQALSALFRAAFGQGSGPIWLDEVTCAGTEAALSLCQARSWGRHNCNHGEDAGVECTEPTQVRLVNSSNRCSGRVEVHHNQQWGTVCDDSWDLSDAEVVCRQLGCGRAVSAPGRASFGQGHGPIWLDDVNCTGMEGAITECNFKPWGVHNCNHSEDVGVVCSEPTDLRLVNGPNRCAGRLEVLHDQQWGSVCDNGWDMEDAKVVCRQLGCGAPISAPGWARFGRGYDPIWLETINCRGTEAALSECGGQMWGIHSCHHGEDASVVCSGQGVQGGSHHCCFSHVLWLILKPKWTTTEHLHSVNDHVGSHGNPCFVKVSHQGAESRGGHGPA
ncbi:scavenger receptor cysteine-rich domain-containing group B protein-like [Sarcoramphus papa]